MSRDLLAQRRAAQAQQQQQQQQYPAPPSNTTAHYGEDYQQQGPYSPNYVNSSGIPQAPPSYDRQQQQGQGRRRPSQGGRRNTNNDNDGGDYYANYDNPPPSQQQQRQQYPPQPTTNSTNPRRANTNNYNNTTSPPYGGREDAVNSYYEKNQSSVALNSNSASNSANKGRSGNGSNNSRNNYQEENSYEMQLPSSPPYSANAPGAAGIRASGGQVISDAPEIDMSAFFEELDDVRNQVKEMEQHISYLDQLHSRNLQGTGGEQVQVELQQASEAMRKLTNKLRKRIKSLEETTRIRTHGQAEQDRQVRKTQNEGIKNKFLEQVQNYQNMEMKYRDKNKQRIERQYQIVKPNASPEEVRQVVDGGQEVQVFAQALRQSNRVGNAQNVLNEVQSRHEDIKQIERTLVELFQLFQDMAIMVEEQDEQLQLIEQKAEEVAKDVEAGHTEIVQAVGSAKKARSKRKCCCWIMVILLLIIGGVVAYLVVKVIIPKVNENKDKDDDKPQTKTVTQSNAGTRTQQAAVNTNTNGNTFVNVNANANTNAARATGGATTTQGLRVRDLFYQLAVPVATSTVSSSTEDTTRRYMV